MVFWVFLIIFVLLLAIIWFLRLSFVVLVSFDGDGFHLDVKITFFKILTLYEWSPQEGGFNFLCKKKKDVSEKQKKKHKGKKGPLAGNFELLFSWDTLSRLKKKIKVSDVSVKGRVASKDAAQTALLYGGLWSVIGTLTPFISQKSIILDFYPDFHKDIPDLRISCILRTKITHIIVVIAEFKRGNKKKV
ncbi:MAG TPA: hypothetical protein DD738_11085 [Ruminiclostridium sp.]|nr:hypothetical protein [Ruminiclostridium sp.]